MHLQKRGETVPVALTAGPLRLLYDNGMLRSVRRNDTEFVRRIYMALRDRHWNTIPYAITSQTIEVDTVSFTVTFDAIHEENDIAFSWKGVFRGDTDGTITVSMDGCASSPFLRNRIGWCVLHPLALCKGAACEVVPADGTVLKTRFPGDAIAPHEPFPPFSTLRYGIDDTSACTISFKGDLFETEDQRNWTDASFKTYSTPQSLPAPVQVHTGDRISQTITIALSPAIPARTGIPVTKPGHSDRKRHDDSLRPQIGLGITLDEILNRNPVSLPQPLPADHLRLSLEADRPVPPGLAKRITSWCTAHDTRLELALYLSESFNNECHYIAESLTTCAPLLERILLLHRDVTLTRPGVLDAAQAAFGYLAADRFFTGTDRYFVEINRADSLAPPPSGICFSATPQVHTFDDCAIIDNTEGLGEVLRHAARVCKDRPVALSALTLRPRKNPLRPEKAGGDDMRQTTGFGAQWLAEVLEVLFRSPVHSCTLFTGLTGAQGLFDEHGEPFPLYHSLTSYIIT